MRVCKCSQQKTPTSIGLHHWSPHRCIGKMGIKIISTQGHICVINYDLVEFAVVIKELIFFYEGIVTALQQLQPHSS